MLRDEVSKRLEDTSMKTETLRDNARRRSKVIVHGQSPAPAMIVQCGEERVPKTSGEAGGRMCNTLNSCSRKYSQFQGTPSPVWRKLCLRRAIVNGPESSCSSCSMIDMSNLTWSPENKRVRGMLLMSIILTNSFSDVSVERYIVDNLRGSGAPRLQGPGKFRCQTNGGFRRRSATRHPIFEHNPERSLRSSFSG